MNAFDRAWVVVKSPTMYHGGMPWEGEPELPIFFTPDKGEARGYARERGSPPTLHTVDMKPFQKPASIDDVIEASKGLVENIGGENGNENWPEIQEHSPYEGHGNPYDLLYIPRIRDALRAKGFDGVRGMDILSNYSIPVAIPLDTSQFTVRESKQISDDDDDDDGEEWYIDDYYDVGEDGKYIGWQIPTHSPSWKIREVDE